VQAVEARLRGLRRAEKDFDITARFIVCGLRQFPPESSLEMARLAVEFSNERLAFDLAGAEKEIRRRATSRHSGSREH